MAKARKYHTLLVRDNDDYAPWGIHFGDFDRATVLQEREDIIDSSFPGYARKNTKVITTDAGQAAIDAKVAELNG